VESSHERGEILSKEGNKDSAENLLDIIDSICETYKMVSDCLKDKEKMSEIPHLLNEIDNSQIKYNQIIESLDRNVLNETLLKNKLINLRDIHKKVTEELTLNFDGLMLEVEKINKIKANKNPYLKEKSINPAFFDNHS
jgi:hypothetical protein